MSKKRLDYRASASLNSLVLDLGEELSARPIILTVNGCNVNFNAVEWYQHGGTVRLVAASDGRPTFEQFVDALTDKGPDDLNANNVICKPMFEDGVYPAWQEDVELTSHCRAAYERLYGEQDEVKPKPKISEVHHAFMVLTTQINLALRGPTGLASKHEQTAVDVLKTKCVEWGLAHLIDWEDGS